VVDRLRHGQVFVPFLGFNSARHKCRMVEFLPGELLCHVGIGCPLDDDDHTICKGILDYRHLYYSLADQPLGFAYSQDRSALDDFSRFHRVQDP